MHYLISYDIAADRLRTRVGRLLERHGCRRVQRSVFAAPQLTKRELGTLKTALGRLLSGKMEPSDSLFMVALESDALTEAIVFGDNNVLTNFEPLPLHFRL